jgi:hypothetical protein
LRTPASAFSSAFWNSSLRAGIPSPVKTTVKVAGERPNSFDIKSCTLSASEFAPSNPPPLSCPESPGAKKALEIRTMPQSSKIAHRKR